MDAYVERVCAEVHGLRGLCGECEADGGELPGGWIRFTLVEGRRVC